MTLEYSSQNQADAAGSLQTALELEFPNCSIWVRPRNILGDVHIACRFTRFTKENWPHGIAENDPGYMAFSIWHEDDGSCYIERPTIHGGPMRELKFRKIKAFTEAEAVGKLIKWFEKNAETIASLLPA